MPVRYLIYIIVLSGIIFFSCVGNKKYPTSDCTEKVLIDKEYNTRDRSNYEIISAALESDFIKLKIKYTGSEKSKFIMHTSGLYEETYPASIEICLKRVTDKYKTSHQPIVKELCYDVSTIRMKESNTLIIKLYSHINSFIYKY